MALDYKEENNHVKVFLGCTLSISQTRSSISVSFLMLFISIYKIDVSLLLYCSHKPSLNVTISEYLSKIYYL